MSQNNQENNTEISKEKKLTQVQIKKVLEEVKKALKEIIY